MKTVALKRLGGLGNQLHRAARALALCEQNGYELHAEPSVLEQIFTLGGRPVHRITGSEDISIDSYCQTQADINYTRADCRRWFEFRPEVKDLLSPIQPPKIAAHLRRGDYMGAGFPGIAKSAYIKAVEQVFGSADDLRFISDESPYILGSMPPSWEMLPDFYQLMMAPVLFRGNSTFSYWASVLGTARTFSPLIRGLTGGVEHDNVQFVEGNWPACADLPGIVTDLHLPE